MITRDLIHIHNLHGNSRRQLMSKRARVAFCYDDIRGDDNFIVLNVIKGGMLLLNLHI